MRPYVLLTLAILGTLLVAGCTKNEHGSSASPSSGSAAPDALPATAKQPAPPSASAPASASASASVAPAAAALATGTATLVMQKVHADCGGMGGWAGTKEQTHYLGVDLFVLVQGDDPQDKPRKEFVFCPSHRADGGPQKPQLQVWQNCSSFPSCKLLSSDAGSEGRVEVQCGKENVVLERAGTRTILRGSFGEREVAPRPTRIAPLKSDVRKAMVDC